MKGRWGIVDGLIVGLVLLVVAGCVTPTAVVPIPTPTSMPAAPTAGVATVEAPAVTPSATQVMAAVATASVALPATATVEAVGTTMVEPTAAATAEVTEVATAVSEVLAMVAAQALNVRAGPGVVYARQGALTQGDQVVLEGRNAPATWVRGQAVDGDVAGWLAAEYLAIEGDVMVLPVLATPVPPTPAPTPIPPQATATAVAAQPPPPTASPVPRQPGVCVANRLVNAGFEGGFSTRGRNEVVVADGWSPWYKTDPGSPGINSAPEYKPEPAAQYGMRRIHSGGTAQKWFTTFATHTAGLFQQVSGIPMGSRLEFSAWVQVWSSDEDNNEVSAVPGNYRVLVGIDPTGGTDWSSDNVVWSEPTFAYDAYKQLIVTATARNPVVTVFLQGVPEFPVKHNDSYWDDACLQVIGG